MRHRSLVARRTRLCPSCEFLESRQLMDAAGVGSKSALFRTQSAATTTQPSHSFISLLPSTPTNSFSTIPANGDLNPYGVAKVPRGFLVTNFNNSNNLQGTGTTIQKVFLNGSTQTWFQAPQGFGLTGAIGVLSKGFVFVGSVPTTDGTSATVQQGSLLVLNRFGKQIANLHNPNLLDGPWGMAVKDNGDTAQVFVSNVLNGTITRLNVSIKNGLPVITTAKQIATGYTTQTSNSALVLGPTGMAYNAQADLLYVASTADNAIYAIPNASSLNGPIDKGVAVVQNNQNLHGPIGLAFAPNGDLLITNGDAVNPDPANPSLLLEFRPRGEFVNAVSLDPAEGANFGLIVKKVGQSYWLGTANDDTNTFDIRIASKSNLSSTSLS
jgi:hypothetical protein